jgi:YtkA-like
MQSAQLATPAEEAPPAIPAREVAPPRWLDRLMRGLIFGGGAFVFLALAWVHLGVGAWLFPPLPSSPHQIAAAGPYTVTFDAPTGQLTVYGSNAVTLTLRDAAGHTVNGATVHTAMQMTTMSMPPIEGTATAQSNGIYRLHPLFNMAGIWKMQVVIILPGQAKQQTDFTVSVRWQ